MTANDILREIEPLGRESYRNVIFKHGVKPPCFGVKISDLKVIRKRVGKNYRLALDLYDTGNYDAMYLAGLIADDARMTRKDLERWVGKAYCRPLVGSTVPWVSAESPHGHSVALEWIDSSKPLIATAGWATLGSLVSIKADADLDLAELKQLLQRARKIIHDAPDAVRYAMNWFVIAVGCHVRPLSELAIETGEKIGPVKVNLGDNSCEAFFSPDYIRKAATRGTIGKKRKTAKC